MRLGRRRREREPIALHRVASRQVAPEGVRAHGAFGPGGECSGLRVHFVAPPEAAVGGKDTLRVGERLVVLGRPGPIEPRHRLEDHPRPVEHQEAARVRHPGWLLRAGVLLDRHQRPGPAQRRGGLGAHGACREGQQCGRHHPDCCARHRWLLILQVRHTSGGRLRCSIRTGGSREPCENPSHEWGRSTEGGEAPGWQGATTENRVFDGGATQPTGMHRRPMPAPFMRWVL